MHNKIKLLLSGLLMFLLVTPSFTQEKLQKNNDSIWFSKPYPYVLPILGQKVHERKIRPQLPFGIMFNSLVGQQKMSISGLNIGFGNINNPDPIEMIDLSDIVKFNDIKAVTTTYNIRLDSWILPFLDVYGMFGQVKKASIDIGITDPFSFDVQTDVQGTYLGFGAMANYAIGSMFFSLDYSHNYSYNPRLDDPAIFNLFGFRTGPIIKFDKHPQMNLVIWTGVMYSQFKSETVGTINTADLAPNATAKVEEMIGELDSWYNGLNPIKQQLYKQLYNKLNNGLTSLESGIENTYIRYDMSKNVEKPWDALLGAQWQINNSWQIRTEFQFLGDRTAGLLSVNYRFGIKGHNWFSK